MFFGSGLWLDQGNTRETLLRSSRRLHNPNPKGHEFIFRPRRGAKAKKMICQFPKGSDQVLSKDFNLREFHCRCQYPECQTTYVSEELIEALQMLRDAVGALNIHDGFRCERHNKDIGGEEKSFHKMGMAADISSVGIRPETLANGAKRVTSFRLGGIGIYQWGCHVDVRGVIARW